MTFICRFLPKIDAMLLSVLQMKLRMLEIEKTKPCNRLKALISSQNYRMCCRAVTFLQHFLKLCTYGF